MASDHYCETPLDCGCKGRVIHPDSVIEARRLVAAMLLRPNCDTRLRRLAEVLDA